MITGEQREIRNDTEGRMGNDVHNTYLPLAGQEPGESARPLAWRGRRCWSPSLFVALAGMVDTMMVSSIGAYAVAAVG